MNTSILSLAWRNIWRNKRRTLLTVSGIAFAGGVLVFFISLQLSSYDTMIRTTVSVYHGFLQVQAEGYQNKPEIRRSISNASGLLTKLSGLPAVKHQAPRAETFALVSSRNRSYGAQIVGVVPKMEEQLSTLPHLVRQGQYFNPHGEPSAVLGERLAKNLKLSIGEEVTILGQGRDGSLAAGVFKVAGTFRSGAIELDRGMLQIELGDFQEIFEMPDQVHRIAIRSERLESLDQLKRSVNSLISGESTSKEQLAALSWNELVPGLLEAIELDMNAGWIFYAALVLIVTLSVLNTFLMSILERQREFGILLALGMKPIGIISLVTTEVLLLTLTGLVFGIAIGSLAICYFGIYGFYVPGSEEVMAHWNLPAAIKTQFSFAALTRGPAVIFFSSLLAALYPIFKIRGFRPSDLSGTV